MLITMSCTAPTTSNIVLNIFQPLARFCTPPAKITRYAMSDMPSMTTAKDIKKPTERHMEQKYRSFSQSSRRGKCSHLPVREEQNRCSPYV